MWEGRASKAAHAPEQIVGRNPTSLINDTLYAHLASSVTKRRVDITFGHMRAHDCLYRLAVVLPSFTHLGSYELDGYYSW